MDQIAPATIERYEEALTSSNIWVAEKTGATWQFFLGTDVRTFWGLAAMYLTSGYSDRTLGLSHASNLLCGIRRRLLVGAARGEVSGETLDGLSVLSRIIGRWKQVDPHEFRLLVPLGVTKAILGVLMSGGHWTAALCVALGFFCLIRLEELKNILWRDIRVLTSIFTGLKERTPRIIICIREPN